nr:hypothetical protein [Nostoc sp. DedQUE02]
MTKILPDRVLADLLAMTNWALLHHLQSERNNQAVSITNAQLW